MGDAADAVVTKAGDAVWPPSGDEQVVRFAQPMTARYVAIVATREVNGNPFTGIAEIALIE